MRFFQSSHQLADGRRRDVQFIGCRNITQVAGSRFKRAQRVQVVGRSHSFRKSFPIPVAQIISFGSNSTDDHSFMHGKRDPLSQLISKT
jgi:hypothetical protein